MPKYILSLDVGTTSCRSIIYNQEGSVVAQTQHAYSQLYPQAGWVEQDALEIWNSAVLCMQNVIQKAKIQLEQIEAIGISNQRESVVLWDKTTGLPVYNAIIWQDSRTSEFCEKIKHFETKIQQKTGLILNPYFSATKINWILDNVSLAQHTLKQNNLLAGTIDSWIVWKLSQGNMHISDVSNASRTMLFNIHALEWDQELLTIFNVPKQILPNVVPSAQIHGAFNSSVIFANTNTKIKIASIIGDQQASLFGHLCVHEGMIKNTYGTGCFALVNTGTKIIQSKHKLLSTIAWQFDSQKPIYALEGSVFAAGSVIEWIKNDLQILYHPSQLDFYASLAAQSKQNHVYFVPSFNGLGAPYWDPDARGAIMGLTRGTKREHIIQAGL